VIRPLVIDPVSAKIKILAESPPVAGRTTEGGEEIESEEMKISILFNLQYSS
jgi:hypothetical protein